MATAYKATKDGVGIQADSKFVPEDPANRDWQEKLVIEAAEGLDVDAAFELPIDDAIAAAAVLVNAEADRRRLAFLPPGQSSQTWFVLRYLEAAAFAGAPGGTYPLLAAEVDETGDTVEDVATAVLAEVASAKDSWVPIEEARVGAIDALSACTTQSQVDAVLAAIVWP